MDEAALRYTSILNLVQLATFAIWDLLQRPAYFCTYFCHNATRKCRFTQV